MDASRGSRAESAPGVTKVAVTTALAQIAMGVILLKNNVTKAEIICGLNTIMTHRSFRSAELFPVMFPTSDVATRVHLGKDKVEHSICHCLVPFFQNMLLSSLISVPHLVDCINESLNKIAQK